MSLRIVCLLTSGRAGSKLFHSFLDWHPQVMGFPRNLSFDEFWRSYAPIHGDPAALIDAFIRCHPRFFSGEAWYRFNRYDRADQLGPGKNETFSVDTERFRRLALAELASEPRLNRRSLFLALHRAYHAACGRPPLGDGILLYHIHDINFQDEVAACLDDFPAETQVLIMARHPIEGVNACLKWMVMHNTLSCEELFSHQRSVLIDGGSLIERFPGLDIRTVPYEQLLGAQEAVMRAFAAWTGIRWNESLRRSTMHGKLWWGNGKAPRQGVNGMQPNGRPSSWLERCEWTALRSLAPVRLTRYGYLDGAQQSEPAGRGTFAASWLLPTTSEWALLTLSVSPRHWRRVVRGIRERARDPRRRPEGGRGERFGWVLARHLAQANPIVWCYWVRRRVLLWARIAEARRRHNEPVPQLLLESDEAVSPAQGRSHAYAESV